MAPPERMPCQQRACEVVAGEGRGNSFFGVVDLFFIFFRGAVVCFMMLALAYYLLLL